jgi:hypothetical protein
MTGGASHRRSKNLNPNYLIFGIWCQLFLFGTINSMDGASEHQMIKPRGNKIREISPEELYSLGVQLPPNYGDGYVYFLLWPEINAVKIGSSKEPWRRRSEFTIPGLRLIALAQGGIPLERALHGFFEAYRLRGEWFRCAGPLNELLKGPNKLHNRRGYLLRQQRKQHRSP